MLNSCMYGVKAAEAFAASSNRLDDRRSSRL